MRDISFFKPEKFQHYLSIKEVARRVNRDVSWIRKLERAGKIPTATRHNAGKLKIRLWSPEQVDEIAVVVSQLAQRRGRGRKGGKRNEG